MELTLNIYDHAVITKVYKAETYEIKFGTIEDLLEVLDIEKWTMKWNLQNGSADPAKGKAIPERRIPGTDRRRAAKYQDQGNGSGIY